MVFDQERVPDSIRAINEKAGTEVLLSEPAEENYWLFLSKYPGALSHKTEDEEHSVHQYF